jgi:NADH-quinone oxidoreductase subunit D
MTTPADRHLLAVHRSEVAVSVELQTPEMTLNIGPQHPSTHGVLRLVARISGERVESVQPVMGYMHRGYEKLAEVRTYAQITALVNRIDWVSGFANEVPFIIAAERLMGVEAPERAQYIRLILTEMYRIANHLIFLCAFPAELGAPTPLMYALRERERVLDLVEGLTGGRFHPNFNRIGGVKPAAGGGSKQKTVSQDLPRGFIEGTRRAMAAVRHVCDDLEGLVLGNEIVQQRTVGVGVLPAAVAIEYAMSGPNLRASGVAFDLRKVEDYLPYGRFDFDVITMPNGDAYDRCRVRLEEIRQSARIIEQALDSLPAGPLQAKVPRVIKVPKGECYVRAENPKGEMGYLIVSGGGRRPYRVKIRSTSFCNLAVLPWLLEGALIPDIIAILGSLDYVLGDVDR